MVQPCPTLLPQLQEKNEKDMQSDRQVENHLEMGGGEEVEEYFHIVCVCV